MDSIELNNFNFDEIFSDVPSLDEQKFISLAQKITLEENIFNDDDFNPYNY